MTRGRPRLGVRLKQVLRTSPSRLRTLLSLAGVFGLLACPRPSLAADYTLAMAAHADASPHAVLDVVVRHRDFQVGLYTDTIDARWTPSGDRGKGWLGVRGAAAAAGLMISPWQDGRPVPTSALYARYGGLEYGIQRYLRNGWYAGLEGHARMMGFGATPTTEVPVPSARPVVRIDTVVGWYRPVASVKASPGVHLAPASPEAVFQPHVVAEAKLQPKWAVAPRIQMRGGWANGQDAVTRTRLGGLNPYVVPLGGAAWAEWWVEDYVAIRGGAVGTAKRLSAALLSDVAWFDGQTAAGFAFESRLAHQRFFSQVDVGYAPWIPRPDTHTRVSLWIALGLDWGPLTKNTGK